MVKNFLLDTNILITFPESIFVFEENNVLLTDTTLEELDDLKTRPGDVGFSAREAIRVLDTIREKGDLVKGVQLPGKGKLKFIMADVDYTKNHLPDGWSLTKPDNKIINTALDKKCILVTNDISMKIKASIAGLKTESLKNQQISDEAFNYKGRDIAFASSEIIDNFYKNGAIRPESLYDYSNIKFIMNEFFIIKDICNENHTALGRFNGTNIVPLRHINERPCDITPRNVGQKFALEALLTPASEIPLVILKGQAGSAKSFLSLAAGLQKTMNENLYRKILIVRPNIKFDEDIGYLKGDEMDKIRPLIRPSLDNLEVLMAGKDDDNESRENKVNYLFDKGIITAEALAYFRGRSIEKLYTICEEFQNSTALQALGTITRAGMDTKIVMIGDPDQIDNPKLGKKNNGLVYAAEKMLGSKLCMQLTFDSGECVRSPLAAEAIESLKLNK